jgi:hypothetical protein
MNQLRYLLRRFSLLWLIWGSLAWLIGCQARLAPYERVYVNDSEMQMGKDASESFGQYVHSIREGAVPAQATKGSGGCGCN